jgi:hypothetical protein
LTDASGAFAASFHWARAALNPPCPADAVCPEEALSGDDEEVAVGEASGRGVEMDAAVGVRAADAELGSVALVPPLELHAATVRVVASSRPGTER